jgi:hypothetical protein
MDRRSIHDRIMSRNKSGDPVQSAAERSSTNRNWGRAAAFSLFGIVILGAAGYSAMHFDAIGNVVSRPAVADTSRADPMLADTPFLQHARQAGLEACSTVFPALGELLTNGSQYSVQSTWNTQEPDKHAVQALVGMDYATESYNGPAVGVVFAAPTGSACEGTMVRVAPFSMSCANIPSVLPAGSTLANDFGKVSVYALGNGGGDALLLPTGDSCIVISVASATQ